MWNKQPERPTPPPPPAPAPAPERFQAPPPPVARPAAADGGFLGKTVRFLGDIRGQESLVIDGEMEGTIELKGKLTIGPNGKVKANVKAAEVIVQGSVHGHVEAAERLMIHKQATIIGDVKTAGIVIEDGAYFKGGIDIIRGQQQ